MLEVLRRPLNLLAAPFACAALLAAAAGCGSAGSSPTSGGSGGGSATAAAENASVTSGGEGSGGTLVIGMTAANIPPLDTMLAGTQGYEGYRFVGNSIYDALTRHDLKQDKEIPPLEPGLATKWKASKNATTWTFTLREGVTFTDGTPFDADAVLFNFDRFTNPKSPYTTPALVAQAATFVALVDTVTKVDDHTVKIVTKAPDSHLPEDLSTVYMASPAAVKKDPKSFGAHPVGTGPFKYESMTQGQSLTLAPNTSYWGGAPKLDKLVLKPIPEATARIAALRSGAVNWIEYPTPDDIDALKSGGFQILTNSYDHIWPWVLNTAAKPWSDVRVRQAANYAIDREGMATNLLHGTAEAAAQVAPRANAAYDAGNDMYKQDTAKAKALLKAAGYPNGFTTTLEYPTSGSGNMIPGPMNEALQKDLAAVGIKVKLKPIEWSTMLGQYVGGKFPAGIDAINISLSFQQESFWQLAFASTGPINLGKYKNATVDKLIGEAQTTVDATARAQLYQQAAAQITKDAPWLFVVNDRNPRALAPTVHGFVEPKSWFVDLTSTWVGGKE
ncbi:MAG TPA: ABC transporter substrate-binding protein [Baekduia sp.]|nr:ABC transporter substrate-binding protein [Baekduia sp.]